MDLRFSAHAWADYQRWVVTDKKVLTRVNAVIKDTLRSPFDGIGKPEPLKGDISGWWSRQITGEHQLIYRAMATESGMVLEIAACRFQY